MHGSERILLEVQEERITLLIPWTIAPVFKNVVALIMPSPVQAEVADDNMKAELIDKPNVPEKHVKKLDTLSRLIVKQAPE
ncbi:hypothetical protein OO5_00590 [Enterococcus faecalis V583]|uniref:hypothetical protein n=1 Tax=Enterococcus faecalis TaxID=1351 RepID=UPI0003374AD2|nr:hypothetical protein [Enterococcus faecalis]EOT52000.1 hypothetical protein OO5_00590 [Enterococcus faecalis V583]